MLSAAAAAFGYYTSWTLLLVGSVTSCPPPQSIQHILAILRWFKSCAPVVPFARMGDPDTCIHSCHRIVSHRNATRTKGNPASQQCAEQHIARELKSQER